MNKKLMLTGFAIFISLIFLMAPIGAASHSISPATTSSTNYQPNPSLNTNVTWSTYDSGWSPLEYNVNATSNATLNANYSQFYKNPITVNPTDMIAPGTLQGEKLGNMPDDWNSSATMSGVSENTNSGANLTTKEYTTTQNGVPVIITQTTKDGNRGGWISGAQIKIPISEYISQNLQYDYITAIIKANITAGNGVDSYFEVENSTGASNTIGTVLTTGYEYISMNMAQMEDQYHIGLNTTPGAGYSSYIELNDIISLGSGASNGTYYAQLDGLAMSTNPLYIGTNSTGAQITSGTGNIAMAHFSPDFSYSKIINNGYSVVVSQYLQNVTQTQTPITSGSYIEQVGYQGTLNLPSAPGLTYGPANITLNLTVPADQFQVLTLGGSSYINSLGNKTNGTVQLVYGISPTSPTSYYAIVDYTASQWQSISHPAGFFTYDGIAYYYWLAIGAIASLLALGVGVRHAKTKREQTEKVDRITRRGR